METLLSICVGIGLSAACGFRVFAPLLAMSIATMTGYFTPAAGFEWVGTYPAMTALAVAAGLEVAGYYVPWLDNALDTLTTPAAFAAGTLATVVSVDGLSPWLTWSLAVIAGGGIAGAIQGTTGLARVTSTATTGGVANPVLATIELFGAVLISLLAIVAPVLAVVLAFVVLTFAAKKLLSLRQRTQKPSVAHYSGEVSS